MKRHNSPTMPDGWVFTRSGGTPGTDAEWSLFLHRIDLTSIGYYKPGFARPALGTWILGIANIESTFRQAQRRHLALRQHLLLRLEQHPGPIRLRMFVQARGDRP